MLKNTLKIALFLTLVLSVDSILEKRQEKFDPAFRGRHQFPFIFGSIFMIGILRYIRGTFQWPVPYPIFAVLFGASLGTLTIHVEALSGLIIISSKIASNMTTIYLPVLMFHIAFIINGHAFHKAIVQIGIISLLMNFLIAFVFGLILKLVIDPTWSVADGILFGIMVSSIYPTERLSFCKKIDNRHLKQMITLLEGEALVGTSCSLIMYDVCSSYISGWTVHWYQIVVGLLRPIICGIPIGYVVGVFGKIFMRLSYNDTVILTTLTLSISYASYNLGHLVMAGTTSTAVTGLVMGMERVALPAEIDQFIVDMWVVISGVMNSIIYVIIGFLCVDVIRNFYNQLLFSLVSYTLANLIRLVCYVVFYPVLNRTGYGLSFQNMLLCVWMGLKSPISISMWFLTRGLYPPNKLALLGFHITMLYLLFLFINGTFLPILMKMGGVLKITKLSQMNMNNCVKYIHQAREKTVAVLKMDRFLSDANWPLVSKSTNLKHPYKNYQTADQDDEEDEDVGLNGMRSATCPDCKKNLPTEPTPKEFKDMVREAKMRILKLKKIFYSRQYENGMISKEGVHNLNQAVESAMDTEEAVMQLDDLHKLFNKEGFFYRFIRDRFVYFLKPRDDATEPPRKHWRRVCYQVVRHTFFNMFIYFVNCCNLICVLYSMIVVPRPDRVTFYIVYETNIAVFFVLFAEFWLKILGYSWVYIWDHGVRGYFSFFPNIIECFIMCATCADVMLNTVAAIVPNITKSKPYVILWYCILSLRLVVIFRFFLLLSLCKPAYPKIVKYLDRKIDKYRVMAYELGKNYLNGENEILENLNHIIENEKIREIVRQIIDRDRLFLTKVIGLSQKDRPRVASSVKSKLVMNTVLNSMREDIYGLKQSGWVDDYEFTSLMNSLTERYRYVGQLKFVQTPSPRLLFQEISWMGSDETIINFLYDNLSTKKFNEGDKVCTEGESIEGIYILLTGLLMQEYESKRSILEKLNRTGALPIVDYFAGTTYDESVSDYIVTGNCIGELSTITQRPYDCTITAEAACQLFMIKKEFLHEAMEMENTPVNGLECRIWKTVSFRIAVPIMMNVPAYRAYTREQIKFTLERAFVPDLSNYKFFIVNDMMEDVILIEGIIVDFNTRELYIGPCYVPRSVQKCILPRSSTLKIYTDIETRLLFIPAKGFSELDIMLEQENTCELLDDNSPKCLHNIIIQSSRSNDTLMSTGGFNKKLATQRKMHGEIDGSFIGNQARIM